MAVRLAEQAWLKSGNELKQQMISSTNLRPWTSFDTSDVERLKLVAETLNKRWSDSRQGDMWRRLSQGMGYIRSALSAQLFYERYSFLWMALEALLGNLDFETEEYEKVISIGARVAYRAASLLGPPKIMKGKTYVDARQALALELGALYHIRNKAVHEGERNPPIDEFMLNRFTNTVISVFEAIAHNAFRYRMKRIEDLLAWVDKIHPPNNII